MNPAADAPTYLGSWRPMEASDLGQVERIGERVHPGYPEDDAVLAERLALHPVGCFVLEAGQRICGYAVSHPWRFGHPPGLNVLLHALPADPDTWYIHDIALLPVVRGAGLGPAIVERLGAAATDAGFPTLSLTAVGRSLPFWRKLGFHLVDDPAIRPRLASYGDTAEYLARPLPRPDR